jgi:dephospho-CoA kinase
MDTVFVTGPLASGKRTACQYLAQQGFTHIDLDIVAKEFLDDELVRDQLVEAYGRGILESGGDIDRARLAELAFVDAESSKALNSIIWPLVSDRLSGLILGKSCQRDQSQNKFVIEIAMLAEASDFLDLADTTLCVTADESIRIERALSRGMNLDDIKKRIALQASDAERAAICDAVIENNGSLEALHKKIDSWLQLKQQELLF